MMARATLLQCLVLALAVGACTAQSLVQTGLITVSNNSDAPQLTCSDELLKFSTALMRCGRILILKKDFNLNSLDACFTEAGRTPTVITALVPIESQAILEGMASELLKTTGLRGLMIYKPLSNIYEEVKFAVQKRISTLNAFMLGTDRLPELSGLNALVDFTPFMSKDTSGAWSSLFQDIHPFYRENSVVFGGKVYTIPIVVSTPYMYYRKDVFRRYQLSVPDTWEEVLQVASFLNEINWDPSQPDRVGVCFNKPVQGNLSGNSNLLLSIFGSLSQYQGKVQGLVFEPGTMQPLVNSPAMQQAMQMYLQLAALVPDRLGGMTMKLLEKGACALGFEYAGPAKTSAFSRLRGNLGVAIMPGSPRVWERNTKKWMECTPQLCLGSDSISRAYTNTTVYINRVPYTPSGGFGAAVNAYGSQGLWEASYQFVTNVLLLGFNQVNLALSPLLPYGPVRSSQLTPESSTQWPPMYNQTDVKTYLAATVRTISHPNSLLTLRCPMAVEIQAAVEEASADLVALGLSSIPDVMAKLEQTIVNMAKTFDLGGLSVFQSLYWVAINYQPPPAPLTVILKPPDEPARFPWPMVLGASFASVAAAVIVAYLIFKSLTKDARRTLLGKIVAPGVGPATTLLITDVQASTQLWDTLQQETMESSIALHYAILRKIAANWGGHESSSEGDSIILGFHAPYEAVMAAIEAQAALLSADWPEALLQHPLCCPQYAIPRHAPNSPGESRTARNTTSLPAFPLWDVCAAEDTNNTPSAVAPDSQKSSWLNSWLPWRRKKPDAEDLRYSISAISYTAAFRNKDLTALGVLQDNTSTALEPCPCRISEFLQELVGLVPILGASPPPAAILMFRGLRVRIGLHTGIHDERHVTFNSRTGRLQYVGQPLLITNAVSAAGQGGMVLVSETTFKQLDSAAKLSAQFLLASMGEQMLLDVDHPVTVYQAFSHQLAYRSAVLGHLRYSQQLSPSFLDAPYQYATVCFMTAVGVASLMSWSQEVTQDSLELFQSIAAFELGKHDGYIVNSNAGLVLTAFKDPALAIRWALSTTATCLEANWDPQLLEHELGEEVVVGNNIGEGVEESAGEGVLDTTHVSTSIVQGHLHSSDLPIESPDVSSQLGSVHALKTIRRKTLLFRGLRLKCTIDSGALKASIDPSTGRIMYFGRAMNRAARVFSMNKTGQVWCTQDVWDKACPSINNYPLLHRWEAGGSLTSGAARPPRDANNPINGLSTPDGQTRNSEGMTRLAREARHSSSGGHLKHPLPGVSRYSSPGAVSDGPCTASRSLRRASTLSAAPLEPSALMPPYLQSLNVDDRAATRCSSPRATSKMQASISLEQAAAQRGSHERSSAHKREWPLVAGIALGPCKLRGIQDSVQLVQCRYDDQSVVQVASTRPAARLGYKLSTTDAAAAHERFSGQGSIAAVRGTPTYSIGRSSAFRTSGPEPGLLMAQGRVIRGAEVTSGDYRVWQGWEPAVQPYARAVDVQDRLVKTVSFGPNKHPALAQPGSRVDTSQQHHSDEPDDEAEEPTRVMIPLGSTMR